MTQENSRGHRPAAETFTFRLVDERFIRRSSLQLSVAYDMKLENNVAKTAPSISPNTKSEIDVPQPAAELTL
jgi:hypothetical protein